MKNPKFAVLNLNPGIDRTMYLPEPLKAGQLNRASESIMNQGSKAANFAIALKRFGADVEYFSFTGGPFGELCNSFTEKEGINSHYIHTEGTVRLNIKIIDVNGEYTEVNEKGLFVTEADMETLLSLTEKYDFDFIALCGSLPRGVDISTYGRIIERMRARNIKAVLDCDGEALKLGTIAKPIIIKPNRTELAGLACVDVVNIKTKEDAKEICCNLYGKYGVSILCTLDKDGLVYVGEEGIFFCDAIQTQTKGFVGVGDTALAGFLYARLNMELDIKRALNYSVSAATAKINLKGTTLPSKEEVDKIFKTLTDI